MGTTTGKTEWENTLEQMNIHVEEKAVVVMSGGQDSTTCLYWAMHKFKQVIAINFNYGQRHVEETNIAKDLCIGEGIPFMQVDISAMMKITKSALLEKTSDISRTNEKGLPASFVPNRNQIFLTLAHSFAQLMGAKHLVTGVCETDYSGYPDCRRDFIDSLEKTLNLGSQEDIVIHTPLMKVNKAETFLLAEKMGVLNVIIEHTLTCYEGNINMNAWGKGCGECPACKLRKAGFEEYSKWVA